MLEAPNAPGLPHGWRDVVLGDLGEFSTSSVDKKVNTAELPVRLVNYMDVYRSPYLTSQLDYMQVTASRPEIAKSQVLAGDVLFTPSSETPDDVGHSAVVVEALPETLHSYHTVRLRIAPSEAIDLRFRGRFANSSLVLKHFEKCATGSTRYTLSLADFRSAPVRIPPIAEQTKIAQVLDTLDTTIRQTEAIIEKLKQVKQGLLHDLLTRGIYLNGELRPPQSEAPHLYKDSPLGWVPREWEVDHVGQFVTSIVPGRNKPVLDGGEYPWITVSDLLDDDVSESRLSLSVSSDSVRNAGGRTVPFGAVLMSCVGTFGTASVAGCELVANQQLHGFITGESLRPHWLMHVIRYSAASIDRAATQTTIRYLNKDGCESVFVPVPSLAEQDMMLEQIGAIARLARQEAVGVRKLQRLKSGLMDALLTGRVRVTPLLPPEAAP